MASKVKGIPEGASVVIPRLVCRDPAAMIEFCASTFGAIERVRRPGPDGRVAHALMMIGPAMVMIESEWPTLTSRVDHGSIRACVDDRDTHRRDYGTREKGSVVRHSDEAVNIIDNEQTSQIGDSRKDCVATTITDQR
jgi:ribosomal protein L14